MMTRKYLDDTRPCDPRAHHPHPAPNPSRTTAPILAPEPSVLVRKAHCIRSARRPPHLVGGEISRWA